MSLPTPFPSNPESERWSSPFEDLLKKELPVTADSSTSGGFKPPNPMFGTPLQDTALWEGHQKLPDDCAVKCQQFILDQFKGAHFDELGLVREAQQHGWYAPDHGTQPADVGKLLELHGVAVTHVTCMRASFIWR